MNHPNANHLNANHLNTNLNPRQQWICSRICDDQNKVNIFQVGRDKLSEYISYLNNLHESSRSECIVINKSYMRYINSLLSSIECGNIYIGELVIDNEETIPVSYSSEVHGILIAIQRINNRIDNLNRHINFLADALHSARTDQDIDSLCVQIQSIEIHKNT